MENLDVIVSEREMEVIVAGWSVKRDVLGDPVFNSEDEKIGVIDDIIITPDNYVSFAVIGVGGFLGIGKKDVAVPIQQLEVVESGFILHGATEEKLKALPEYEYLGEAH